MFDIPPSTRFDLKFSLFGIPVRVHPLFWLLGILFGARNGAAEMLIWIAVVFFSILAHELGHSFAMRAYGVRSHIVLHIMGGLAIPNNQEESRRVHSYPLRWVLVSLAGPLVGFLIAFLLYLSVHAMGGVVITRWIGGIIPYPQAFIPGQSWYVYQAISNLFWVNIFWGFFNLVPVFPLDGGQAARGLLLKLDPFTGVRNSLWLSVIAGASAAVFGFVVLDSIYMPLLFGVMALQSYQALQRH